MDERHQFVKYGSRAHSQTIQLREIVLRIPLGMRFTIEQLESEKDQFHIAQYSNEVITACLVMKPINAQLVKMRQVAVHPDSQKMGKGSSLVAFTEEQMLQKGFKEIELHARLEAVPFYERLNYQIKGDLFDEIGIPHYKMIKKLTGS